MVAQCHGIFVPNYGGAVSWYFRLNYRRWRSVMVFSFKIMAAQCRGVFVQSYVSQCHGVSVSVSKSHNAMVFSVMWHNATQVLVQSYVAHNAMCFRAKLCDTMPCVLELKLCGTMPCVRAKLCGTMSCVLEQSYVAQCRSVSLSKLWWQNALVFSSQ
ncbi:hypothetical protein CEXT_96241 [Caerostris extrusa]|uniref:Uncharacterized protein n=1 Tax=Caerostris extrusa TaxID=172846 RepID=A0AAV4P611_CAEEX|nr:hypothetical protein CEXT_96241 [Caerostris extrusa]